MVDIVFVIPNTLLAKDILLQVAVRKETHQPGKQDIQKFRRSEIVIPEESGRDPSIPNNPNYLELYIVNGLTNKS